MARRINRHAAIRRTPFAGEIEILERESDGIHNLVTCRADGIVAMRLHLFSHRNKLRRGGIFRQGRHIRRRKRRRGAEDIFENPLASRHRRSSGRNRRDQQNTALAQQAAARVIRQLHAAKAAAVDAWYPIMLCQAFVDEGVIRVQQIDHAPVLSNVAIEEQLGFTPEGFPKIVVETGRFRPGVLEFSQVKPLAGEVLGQRRRFGIGQHAASLMRKNPGIMQLVLLCQPKQFVIRNAAPKEEGKPGGQFEIADGIDPARRRARRFLFEAEDEPGIDEDARQRRFDSMLEAAGVSALLIKAEQCLKIGIADRTPERLRGERRQDLFGAGGFVIGSRMTNEDLAAARRITGPCRIGRSRDRYACNRGIIGIHGINVVGTSRIVPWHGNADGMRSRSDFEMKICKALAGIDARSIESDLDRYRQGARTYAETCAARSNLERVFRIERKREGEEHAAACADRQTFDVTGLRKVAGSAPGVRCGRDRGIADREPADLRGCSYIAFKQCRRDFEGVRDVVESFAGIVGRQERGNVDIESEQIANRVGVFGAVEAVQA